MGEIERFVRLWPKNTNTGAEKNAINTRQHDVARAARNLLSEASTLNITKGVVLHEALVLKVKEYSPLRGSALDPDMGFFENVPPNIELKCLVLTDLQAEAVELPKNIPAAENSADDYLIENSFPSFIGRAFGEHAVEVGDIVIVQVRNPNSKDGYYIKKTGNRYTPDTGGQHTSPEEVHRNLTAGPGTMGNLLGAAPPVGRPDTVLVFGDSQIQGAIGRSLEKQLPEHGWTIVGGGRLGKTGSRPSFWVKNDGLSADLRQRLQARPAIIVINLGGNGLSGTESLLSLIAELSPLSKVIWLGPPPAVKPTQEPSIHQLVYATPCPDETDEQRCNRYYLKYAEKREDLSMKLFDKISSRESQQNVISINAIAAFAQLGMASSPDGVHVVNPWATRYIEKIIEMHIGPAPV